MRKYIDAEKLTAKIKGIIAAVEVKQRPNALGSMEQCLAASEVGALGIALDCIKELQQEKPILPSNLDEAAEKYSENILANNEDLQDAIEDAFKEGAEWMAKQGLTVDGTFHHSCGYPSVIELKTFLRDYEGADVIVNIRKKQ